MAELGTGAIVRPISLALGATVVAYDVDERRITIKIPAGFDVRGLVLDLLAEEAALSVDGLSGVAYHGA